MLYLSTYILSKNINCKCDKHISFWTAMAGPADMYILTLNMLVVYKQLK